MKGIHLISIATVLLTSWAVIHAEKVEFNKILEECPSEDPEDHTITMPHESDCTLYYMCRKGEKILRECPPYNAADDRLHFNPELRVCDWPWVAGCKLDGSNEDQAVATSKKSIPKKDHNSVARTVNADYECPDTNSGGDTILLAHEYDCTKFYMCLGRQKIVQDCPYMDENSNRLHFNPVLKVCDYPYRAGCENKDKAEYNPPIRDHAGDCPKPTPKYPWRHDSDCRLFYKCENGKKYLYECPWGYCFDAERDGCFRQEENRL